MRQRSLQALIAVMETGSVTEAARRLYRTQPQVSRLIAALEDELGFALFLRQGRRLVPTHEGVRFYEEAKRILLGLDEISQIADDIRSLKEARLKIVAQPYVAHALVPDAFVDFRARYPQVRCSLEIRSRGDVAPWIAGQQFDIGIAALPIDAPAVRSEPFASVAVAAILPKGHPLASKPELDAADIAGAPFIALRPFTLLRIAIDSLFASLDLSLAIQFETSSGLSACQLVAKGLGITLADPLVVRCVPQDQIEIRPWRPGLRLSYGFLYSVAHTPSALVLDFAETVARITKQLDPQATELVGPAAKASQDPQRSVAKNG